MIQHTGQLHGECLPSLSPALLIHEADLTDPSEFPRRPLFSWVPRAVIFQEKEITIIFVISIKLLSFDVWKPGLYSVLNWAF